MVWRLRFNSSNQAQAGFIQIPDVQTEYGMGFNGQYAFKDGLGGGLYDNYGYVWGPKLNQKDPGTKSGFVEIPQYNSQVDPTTGQLIPLPWVSRGSNNLKDFLQNQFLTTNNVSVAGKYDRGDFRVSATHLYQKGQVPNTKLNSTTLNVAGNLQITNKLKVDASVAYNKQFTPNYPSTGYGPSNYFYNLVLWMGPDVNVNDMKAYWKPGRENLEQRTYNYTWYNNPWFLANEYLNGYTNDAVITQANLRYDIAKDLSFMIRSGASINNIFGDTKTPFSFINYGSSKSPFGNYNLYRRNEMRIVTDLLLSYKKTFFNDFETNFSLGGSNRYDQTNSLSSNTVDLNVPGTYSLSNSRGPVNSINSLIEKEVNGVYGYADFAYKRMAFITLTGRNDWTSSLRAPYNSFFYPSASMAILPTEMFKFPSFISFAKLRASWADIASDAAAYTSVTGYTYGTRWGGTPSLSLPGTIIPPNLKPNRTISQEYGTELRFLQNRLGVDFTYYDYLDRDFIVNFPISAASGFNSRRVNGNKYNRKGIEVILTGNPVRSKNFNWNITANYSRDREYVEEYYGGITESAGIKVGDRRDAYRGYKWDRSPDGQIIYSGGYPEYYNDVVTLGTTSPDWVFGFINNLSYKALNLGFSFDGRIGGMMFNGVESKMFEGGMHKSTVNQYRDDANKGIDSYIAEGVKITGGKVERDPAGNIINDTRTFAPNDVKANYQDWVTYYYTNGIDEANLYDRTFVKLREVVLSYNLPSRLLTKVPVKSASVSLVGRNLLLWTEVPFMDPDGYTGTTLAEPSYRSVGFNLNMKF